MPADDPRAAAIEAADASVPLIEDEDGAPLPPAVQDAVKEAVRTAVAAAVPHLTRDLRALADERYRCPVHGIPDCSPLLNGCSIPNYIAAYQERLREALDALERGESK